MMQKVNFLIKSLANNGRMLAKDFIRKRIINNERLFKNSIKKNINKNTLERKSYAKVLICCVGEKKSKIFLPDVCHTSSHLVKF